MDSMKRKFFFKKNTPMKKNGKMILSEASLNHKTPDLFPSTVGR